MSYDATGIFPFKSGLSQYFKPFLIGNDAFTELENCYSWRGRIKKREGSVVLGRLPVWKTLTDLTDATPPVVTSVAHGLLTGDMVWLENVRRAVDTITAISTGLITIVTTTGAHGLAIGDTAYIQGTAGVTRLDGDVFDGNDYQVIAVPAANQIEISVDTGGTYTGGGSVYLGSITNDAFYVTVLTANTFSIQTLNDPSVNVPAAGPANTGDIYLPIVGTRIFILTSTGNELLIVFNPKQAFLYNTTTQVFDNISPAVLWTGTKDNFFYTSNYQRVMFTTNNIDVIRYYTGTVWSDYRPVVSGQITLDKALLILPYKGRLVALNTTEAGVTYYNRARWSQIGTVFAGSAAPFSISLITAGVNPTVSALNHTFTNGQVIGISNVVGTIGSDVVNGRTFTVSAVVPLVSFVINADTTGKSYTLNTGFAQLLSIPPTGFANDVDAWRDDIPGKGGFNDADTSERIVSVEIIQDTMIVGFQFSTWRLRYTGNEILPFIWERINTQFGCEATFSTVPFDDGVAMISRRGIVKSSFNDVERIDMIIPDYVNKFEAGLTGEGLNRVHGVRDYQKRLVYWLYGDQASNAQTPNKILVFNYQDNTWSTFDQSFTTLGNYKQTTDNIWATWTSTWESDESPWNTPLEQSNTIMVVAGAKDSRVWSIMQDFTTQDNEVNYNFRITTSIINPYFQTGNRCKLAFFDLYVTTTENGEVTIENFIDDNDSAPWLTKKININSSQSAVKYTRVFLGMVARNHQLSISLSEEQVEDNLIGSAPFEIQGIIMHTRKEGRIKL